MGTNPSMGNPPLVHEPTTNLVAAVKRVKPVVTSDVVYEYYKDGLWIPLYRGPT